MASWKPKLEIRDGRQFGGILAYAKYRGVDKATVSQAVKEGRIPRGEDGMIDFELADVEWDRNTQLRSDDLARRGAGGTPDAARYAQSRAMREEWQAKLAQLDYEAKAGKLIAVDAVAQKWAEICVAIRTAIEGIAPKVAQNVHAARDVREVHDILAAECRDVLRRLSADVAATGGQPDGEEKVA